MLIHKVKYQTEKHFLCGQLQLGNELQYGRVSAAELVQAVDEMLSAVGIHMDVEKQALLQKTITLQEQLKDSQTALLLEQVSVVSKLYVSCPLLHIFWLKGQKMNTLQT